ncbi:hypothetical protein CLU96_3522 [Chryseobacterium sp. 52]|uniref:hypothetical protein n=1 Tax=Chryseobacterium sp. 52 TaxID=2035213 RepID=UPI000C194BF8|nr:hypothetical protein [Chryseobacterium sp. 52]PIF46484.1 hypothetical protein CLU96_3522 [Chryseobacterium sp. 52]
MKNCKNRGWIEEIQAQSDEKSGKGLDHSGCVSLLFGRLSHTSFKENKIADNLCQEISETPLLKK